MLSLMLHDVTFDDDDDCVIAEIRWVERVSVIPRDIGRSSSLGCERASKIQGTLWHDVLWEGKVVHNRLELGKLGWPDFEGVWKGSVWGFFTGESSLKVARSARIPPAGTICNLLLWTPHVVD